MTTDLSTVPAESLQLTPLSIGAILSRAVESKVDPANLERLVALAERISDRAASQEFSAAMARFQQNCPPVPKTSTANIVTRGGSNYAYTYAELDTIAKHIGPHLAAEGLSYSWDSEETGGKLVCTCHVRHVNGHSTSAKFSCSIDSAAAMSGAQKSGAALTYARRQALIQAFGLTTTDADPDAPQTGDAPTIDDNQQANLQALIDEVKANKAAFLAWLRVGSLAEIPVVGYKAAVAALEAKRGGNKK